MSNLGLHNLFHHIASFHGIQAHRFFIEKDGMLLSPDAGDLPSRRVSPERRVGTSGKKDLSGYDAAFFSVSFELGYINIVRMLLLSSIPPVREERGPDHPLVVAGGVAVTANPSFLSGICDVIYTGDMECSLDRLLEILFHHSFRKEKELFGELAGLEGVWVPNLQGGALPGRAVWREVKRPARSVILTRKTEFSGMFLVEIARGCRNVCSFCMTRCVSSPIRTFPEAEVLSAVEEALQRTNRVGLIAPVLTDHRGLVSVVRGINRMGMTVSFSSLRADDFSAEIANLLAENSQSTVTFAPETGSMELRRSIGKGFTNDVLIGAVEEALDHGVRNIRYYFMYGLPGEDMSDIRAIVDLVRVTLKTLSGRRGTLHLSINPFVPKRGTPLERHRLYSPEYYKKVQSFLRGALGGYKNLSLSFESLRHLNLQYVLSIGGGEVGLLLAKSVMKGSLRGFTASAEELPGKGGT